MIYYDFKQDIEILRVRAAAVQTELDAVSKDFTPESRAKRQAEIKGKRQTELQAAVDVLLRQINSEQESVDTAIQAKQHPLLTSVSVHERLAGEMQYQDAMNRGFPAGFPTPKIIADAYELKRIDFLSGLVERFENVKARNPDEIHRQGEYLRAVNAVGVKLGLGELEERQRELVKAKGDAEGFGKIVAAGLIGEKENSTTWAAKLRAAEMLAE